MGRIERIGSAVILFTDGNLEDLRKFDIISKEIKINSNFFKSCVFCENGFPKGFWRFKHIDYFESSDFEARLEEFKISQKEICECVDMPIVYTGEFADF